MNKQNPEIQRRRRATWPRAALFIAVWMTFAPRGGVAAALDISQQHVLLNEANTFFDQANTLSATDPDAAKTLYEKAILRWERIVGEGGVRNGKLYYNLGNAYFLAGDLGRAMLNYRRAEQFIPNDPNLHQNVSYVGNQRTDRIDEPQRKRVLKTLFFWHYDLTTKTRAVFFAAVSLLFWASAAARLFIRRTSLIMLLVFSAILGAALFSSLTVEAVVHAHDQNGVILASEVTGRKGNSETYQPSFQEPLHAGTEFSLLEDRGDWCHIELRDGRECWIPRSAAELVGQS